MHGAGKSKWKNRKPPQSSLLCFSFLSLFLLFIVFFIFFEEISTFILPLSRVSRSVKSPRCGSEKTLEEKFLWYAPHSGFSNQLSEFKNAIMMAAILNRTLIVPPILDHHAVALGSCPKFRVLDPNDLRIKVWDHSIDLIRTGRYVSMAEIIDLSSVSTLVQTIDFRYFVSLWCGVDLDGVCSHDLTVHPSVSNNLRQCGSLLSGLISSNIDKCLYAVDKDCRTTVWTFLQNDSDGALDSFQPDDQLRIKKKISYVRRRQDVYKNLGPGSDADLFSVLAFGSLFTAPYGGSELYIDIHESPGDRQIQSLLGSIEFLPFVPDIINAGKEFVLKTIRQPFLCAQLRLLDGQFKNHWKATFSGLRQKVEALKHKGSPPVDIFVMTDLPRSNWSGTYLDDLASDGSSFKLHVLSNSDELVRRTAEKVAAGGRLNKMKRHCPHMLPDVLLFVEEAVCSCASLGFVGTAGSTIAESVESMRKNKICSEQNQIEP